MVKALIFDYNQVLVDDLDAHLRAYQKTFERHGLKLTREELNQIMHKSHPENIAYLKKKYKLQVDGKKLFKEKEDAFLEIAKKENLPFSGIEEVVQKLSKKFVLGILSGTTKRQMLLPKKLLNLFKAVITIEDYKKPKPDPEGLLACVKKLALKLEKCVYIGDAWHDMVAAKKAGCNCKKQAQTL